MIIFAVYFSMNCNAIDIKIAAKVYNCIELTNSFIDFYCLFSKY